MAWKKVGKVKEAHGLKGELWVIVFNKTWAWLDAIDSFALGRGEDGIDQVYHLEKGRPQSGGLVIRATELQNRNQAEALLNHFFYIESEEDEATTTEPAHLARIRGFEVFDSDQLLGPIIGFASNGPQDLLQVRLSDGSSVDIPFVEAFITEIRSQEKQIRMQLPEGLIEINQKGS